MTAGTAATDRPVRVAPPRPGETRSGLLPIASAALRCFLLIAMAMAVILVLLPAALGAAGTAVVMAP
jgi:hypothetical protein